MRSRIRWFLLCEDRNQERFFVKLGQALFGSVPIKVIKPPDGQGAASHWVIAQYPGQMRIHPRRYPDENVALVVSVDGDSDGWEKRKQRFDEGLLGNHMTARTPNERVAICIPTWSIETWLAALCNWHPPEGALDESRTLKRSVEHAIEKGAVVFKSAVAAWPGATAGIALPSLIDGAKELKRLTRA